MDELIDLVKELARLVPLNTTDKDLVQSIRKSWDDRLEALKGKLPFLHFGGPVAGAPVDEDIPPAPSHWERPSAAAPEPEPAPVVPIAPAPAGETIVAAPAADATLEQKLAALAPAPGTANLPATTLAEQEAAAGAPPAS